MSKGLVVYRLAMATTLPPRLKPSSTAASSSKLCADCTWWRAVRESSQNPSKIGSVRPGQLALVS
eukprot:1729623-Prymnesium_polylepis.2